MPLKHTPNRSLTRAQFLHLSAGLGAATLFPGGTSQAATPIMTRAIPSTGEALPVIGLGTSRTFDVGQDPKERAPRKEVLRLLFEASARVIDTSPMYGRAEAVTGDLLAELGGHDQAYIATKVWSRGRRNGIEQMNASLRTLRAERIELMQIHNLLDWRTHLATLRAWKEQGRFRYIGITHYTSQALDDLARIIEDEPIDFVQCAYSLAVRDAEQRLLPLAAERGVAVLVNRPYEAGALFGKVRGREVPAWAAAFEAASWGQFLLKFVLGHPAVTCVIPGTSKPKHMLDNLAAGRGRLPDAAERKRMIATFEDL